jgi:hypothetical protein
MLFLMISYGEKNINFLLAIAKTCGIMGKESGRKKTH